MRYIISLLICFSLLAETRHHAITRKQALAARSPQARGKPGCVGRVCRWWNNLSNGNGRGPQRVNGDEGIEMSDLSPATGVNNPSTLHTDGDNLDGPSPSTDNGESVSAESGAEQSAEPGIEPSAESSAEPGTEPPTEQGIESLGEPRIEPSAESSQGGNEEISSDGTTTQNAPTDPEAAPQAEDTEAGSVEDPSGNTSPPVEDNVDVDNDAKDLSSDSPAPEPDGGPSDDYPKASFIKVSYCDDLHERLIHEAALESVEALKTTLPRLTDLEDYLDKNNWPAQVPPLREYPSKLASTYRTFESILDGELIDENGSRDIMNRGHVWRVANVIKRMIKYANEATEQTRFTEITCGIPWITRTDEHGHSEPGRWYDNRTTSQGYQNRFFQMLDVPLANNQFRPWDIADGFPYAHMGSGDHLVGSIWFQEHGYQYDTVVVLQEWPRWWGWEHDGFQPRGQRIGADQQAAQISSTSESIPADPPPYASSWSELRARDYPPGSFDVRQLVLRRLMPALLASWRLSVPWICWPAKYGYDTMQDPYLFVPYDLDRRPWDMAKNNPDGPNSPKRLGELIAKMYTAEYKPHGKHIGAKLFFWPEFVYFVIAMYVDKYDWSTGINRPLEAAYDPAGLDRTLEFD